MQPMMLLFRMILECNWLIGLLNYALNCLVLYNTPFPSFVFRLLWLGDVAFVSRMGAMSWKFGISGCI